MFDWHTCQICYPIEIKLLSLLLLCLVNSVIQIHNHVMQAQIVTGWVKREAEASDDDAERPYHLAVTDSFSAHAQLSNGSDVRIVPYIM